MGSKLQKYLLGTIIVLVVLLIAAKYIYNQKLKSYPWEQEDRDLLIQECIDKSAHYAVRFPSLTKEYCACTADSIMYHLNKAEYLQVSNKSLLEQQEVLMPVISACYNRYQTRIFEETELGDF